VPDLSCTEGCFSISFFLFFFFFLDRSSTLRESFPGGVSSFEIPGPLLFSFALNNPLRQVCVGRPSRHGKRAIDPVHLLRLITDRSFCGPERGYSPWRPRQNCPTVPTPSGSVLAMFSVSFYLYSGERWRAEDTHETLDFFSFFFLVAPLTVTTPPLSYFASTELSLFFLPTGKNVFSPNASSSFSTVSPALSPDFPLSFFRPLISM